ncbi:hypothetical protein FRC03_010493 [Tulasnella sp. 419]|nr:hypothetical protein FRC02_000886 [Tulasnella sp. 418]KAG8957155.1 hypothetical protein FRC03_010493 [Tulasnella sp. 419]
MIIPINLPNVIHPADGQQLPPILANLGSNEVVLIELQGSLELEGDRTGEIVGDLSLEIPARPTLSIGHHLLEGKVTNLPKPLAVLSRNSPINDGSGILKQLTSDSDPNAAVEETGDENNGSFDVVAIVKKKIVFAKRPVPITNTMASSSATATTAKK